PAQLPPRTSGEPAMYDDRDQNRSLPHREHSRRDGWSARRWQRKRSPLSGVVLALVALVSTAGVPAFAAQGDCGQPQTTGSKPTAGDALSILHAAVGERSCAACICDVNGSQTVTATDALVTLKSAVGQDIALVCP